MNQARSHADARSAREKRLESIVKVETRADGVALVAIDDPAGSTNTITPALVGELTAALDHLASDSSVRAVVVRSAKKDSFVGGANVDFVRSLRFATDAEEAAREISRRFDRLGGLIDTAAPRSVWRAAREKPIVALVHGPALGGGFELALACTATVATDDASTVLGLPEVKLGMIPVGNGLFRIAERAGLRIALDLGLSGRTLRARQARELGLVDEVVPVGSGLEAAIALAARLAEEPRFGRKLRRRRQRASGRSRVVSFFVERSAFGRMALFHHVRRTTFERTRGHYPAAHRIIDLLERFGARGFASASTAASRSFGELVLDASAHRLLELFVAKNALRKDSGLEPDERDGLRVELVERVERVGVIGGGVMGAGIAAASAIAGCVVQVRETDDASARRAVHYAAELVDARRRRGVIPSDVCEHAKAKLVGTSDVTKLADCDFVFEAVLEDRDRKRAVLRELGEAVVQARCVVASATASIPIARMADAYVRPEYLVGMHYAGSADLAPLVEVVRSSTTDPRAIATAVAFGKRQGKTVIVVRDGVGFYTTRARVPFLNEAAHLLAEGVPIDFVDEALLDWGFRVGPFELFDEVGIDVCVRAARHAEEAFGSRMCPPAALYALHGDGRKGRKNARGFYLHGTAAPRRRTVDTTVYRVLGTRPKDRHASATEVALRCSLALVNEALRCHGEGIVRSARDGDVGAILGLGFPAFRGGPFRHVDVESSPEILRHMRTLEQRFGERFAPAPLLVEMARQGKRFYG